MYSIYKDIYVIIHQYYQMKTLIIIIIKTHKLF